MEIPEFLRRENQKKPSQIDIEFDRLIEEYQKLFGDSPMTEPSAFSDEEWIKILTECVDKKITTWEYFGEEYDPEADY